MTPYFETGQNRETILFNTNKSGRGKGTEKKDPRCNDGRNLGKDKNRQRKTGRYKRQLPPR